jgi:hypothetical protein
MRQLYTHQQQLVVTNDLWYTPDNATAVELGGWSSAAGASLEPSAPDRRLIPMRWNVAILVTAALCATSTACGGILSRGQPGSPTSPPTGVVLTATDAENGHRITVHVGDRVSVILHSTYWNFAASSNALVMAPDGSPTVSPSPSGCVPGQGCGTVTAAFVAIAPGSARLTASRISCGEALRCTGSAGIYRLTVTVTSSG